MRGRDQRGLRRTLLGLVAVAVVVIVVIVVASRGDERGLTVEDGVGDCREAGRDFGDRCDAGSDVQSLKLSRDGDSLVIVVELDSQPALGASVAWRMQLNIASENGKVCGLANVDVDSGPSDTATGYGFDPAFGLDPLTRRALPPGICDGVLDGKTARFVVDMSGEDPAETFRVGGFTLLEFPDDAESLGSEDDFGFRGTLAEIG